VKITKLPANRRLETEGPFLLSFILLLFPLCSSLIFKRESTLEPMINRKGKIGEWGRHPMGSGEGSSPFQRKWRGAG
jgi:hypothetical protein